MTETGIMCGGTSGKTQRTPTLTTEVLALWPAAMLYGKSE